MVGGYNEARDIVSSHTHTPCFCVIYPKQNLLHQAAKTQPTPLLITSPDTHAVHRAHASKRNRNIHSQMHTQSSFICTLTRPYTRMQKCTQEHIVSKWTLMNPPRHTQTHTHTHTHTLTTGRLNRQWHLIKLNPITR